MARTSSFLVSCSFLLRLAHADRLVDVVLVLVVASPAGHETILGKNVDTVLPYIILRSGSINQDHSVTKQPDTGNPVLPEVYGHDYSRTLNQCSV